MSCNDYRYLLPRRRLLRLGRLRLSELHGAVAHLRVRLHPGSRARVQRHRARTDCMAGRLLQCLAR